MNYERVLQYDSEFMLDYPGDTQALRRLKINSKGCVKYFLGYYTELLFDLDFSKYGNVNSPYIEYPQISSFRINQDFRENTSFCSYFKSNADVNLQYCIQTFNTVLYGRIFTEQSLLQLMDILVDWMFGENKYNFKCTNDTEYNITLINKIIDTQQRKEQIETDFKVVM